MCVHFFPAVRAWEMGLKNGGHCGSGRKIQGRRLLVEAPGCSNGWASFLGREGRQVDGVSVYFKGGVIYFSGRKFIQLDRII